MADDDVQSDDRTEEATPERREEFREKGQVAMSRELNSVAVLATSIAFITAYFPTFLTSMRTLLVTHFQTSTSTTISQMNFLDYSKKTALEAIWLVAPLFLATSVAAISATLLQTRFNVAWSKIRPDFNRLNPWSGLLRMMNLQAAVELLKGVGKVAAVGIVSYLILFGEWNRVPGLMSVSAMQSWSYWGEITKNLFWGVAILLLAIAAGDYFYNFMSLENKLRMTKKEVKEEMKRREVDPHVRARMRRMQRDMASRRMVEKTKTATVLITNPTHFSIALRYEVGMMAPQVVAKGQDFLALQMREEATKAEIPIIENKPLARTLYKMVEVDQFIPESLYKAVSEIIRYVFKLKGIHYQKAKV